jgi:hypothetical protein
MTATEPRHLLAAMSCSKDELVDRVLEDTAHTLQARGYRVGGYLQRQAPATDGCCAPMYLEHIENGERSCISQALGAGARGCRLDPRALARLSASLLAELEAGMQLLVLNRFGKGESEGQGFRALIERAFQGGIPVLTAVRPGYMQAWRAFGGDYAQELRLDRGHVLAWCLSALDGQGTGLLAGHLQPITVGADPGDRRNPA